jgi:hypothetical protein
MFSKALNKFTLILLILIKISLETPDDTTLIKGMKKKNRVAIKNLHIIFPFLDTARLSRLPELWCRCVADQLFHQQIESIGDCFSQHDIVWRKCSSSGIR